MTKRSHRHVGFALLCGILVTAGLAVLTPFAADFERSLDIDHSGTKRHCGPLPAIGPRDYFRSWAMTSWLVRRVAVWTFRSSNDERPLDVEFDPPEALPSWCTLGDLLADPTQHSAPGGAFSSRVFVEQAAGWPFATTRCLWNLDGASDRSPATSHAWELPARNSRSTIPGHFTAVRAVPTELLPLGAVANIAFWAVAVSLLLQGLDLIVRCHRIARGRCAQCGYTLVAGIANQCPECGAPANRKPAERCVHVGTHDR